MAPKRLLRSGLLAALLLGPATEAPGQTAPEPDRESARIPADTAPVGAGRASLYSALLPGSGQYTLGARRWAVYAAIEVVGWSRFLERRSEGRSLERGYRDLAWEVARSRAPMPRRDGGFEYYEAMSRFARSGVYDADPAAAGVQPETDEGTYNGSVWALARAIYYPAEATEPPPDTPEHARALAYYRERAVRAEYAWAWNGREGERARFGELIRESDEALRAAAHALGLILANHLVSAVDALVVARLGNSDDASSRVQLESGIELRGDRPRWVTGVRVPWPWR